MAKPTTDNLARDLVRLLSELTGLYGELAMHMHDKLEAIKRADTDRIMSITARQITLADRVAQRNGLRRQITRRLQQELRSGPGGPAEPGGLPAEAMRITDLAEHLPEPRRSQLITVAAGLKKQLSVMEQLRLTSTMVTQEMLKHLEEILSVMTAGGPGGDVYLRTGNRQASSTAHVFEAVG